MKALREYQLTKHLKPGEPHYLWGRASGKEVREDIEAELGEAHSGDTLVVQMRWIRIVDVSFAAELYGKLIKLWPTSYLGKALVIANPSEEAITNITAALNPLNLLALVVFDDANGHAADNVREGRRSTYSDWRLVGKAADTDIETIDVLAKEGQATAPQIASKLGINLTTANQRLRKLAENGVIVRSKMSAGSGGEQYQYRWPLEQP